ncbi:homoserine kinase [Leptospira idonii]|uniref:Homoserine kinase n=1 Tax=Leptospira idonii TaxID=1193500 RepID=A0A4R9M3M8_9LEPT|nr:homoserine kinase [Leptospira idonii]TGN20581.1 homoserine kinase [Leptospira idonii]
MRNLPKIKIKVPGTSANLGPGFDLMGMALKVYNEFEFVFLGKEDYSVVLKNGEEPPFSPKEDLVREAYEDYFHHFLPNESIPTYHCKMNLSLPLKGGLGSSASAIVAGLCLGREVHSKLKLSVPLPSEKEFLQFLAEWEGHPDNTLPAYLGGFVFAYSTHGEPLRYFRKKFPSSVSLFVLTPKFTVATEESRKTLPAKYPTADVIFNLSRIGAWMHFLDKRRFSDLLVALEDKVHTPYRIHPASPLFPLLKIFEKDRVGHCLSGSGPSLLVFAERKNANSMFPKLESEIRNVMNDLKIEFQLQKIQPDHLGTRISFH